MSKHIRNFAVLSHIDHGKTTLTDRLLEVSRTIDPSKTQDRLLDSHPIERERGITIKLAPVTMSYRLNNTTYALNLIDTPGHVDFSYEVSRSLAACEGALLLVDASQGIQAQTIANAYLGLENNLEVIPVINKIDLPSARADLVTQDLIATFGFKADEINLISAKTGQNVTALLQTLINKIPPPKGDSHQPLTSLIFNSHFDTHKGVIVTVRVFDGHIKTGDQLKLMVNGSLFQAKQVGIFSPHHKPRPALSAGEVGYIATGLKDVSKARVGDTVTSCSSPAATSLLGYQEPKPVVFVEIYPIDNGKFPALKDAISKLRLNDASLTIESASSQALGNGIRVGFLGLLHADIVQERLERDFGLELIATTPTVTHLVTLTSGKIIDVKSASDLPDPSQIKLIKEPLITATIFTPVQYLNEIIKITQSRRSTLIDQQYFGSRVLLKYTMPLSELISGYYSHLKSVSSGYASLDYQFYKFAPVEAVKLEILVNKEPVPPLASIVVKQKAVPTARRIVDKLKDVLPRQQFQIPIQAALGGKIIARANLKALRKDVTAKLYGGDQTRKDKLLKKQKKGKKRLKQFGKVIIPQEAFLAVLDQNS